VRPQHAEPGGGRRRGVGNTRTRGAGVLGGVGRVREGPSHRPADAGQRLGDAPAVVLQVPRDQRLDGLAHVRIEVVALRRRAWVDQGGAFGHHAEEALAVVGAVHDSILALAFGRRHIAPSRGTIRRLQQ
jgi:hypothetical protein